MPVDTINSLPININQDSLQYSKTKNQVEFLNQKLKVDGKEQVKDLGKDEFLKLLITELQHQDPTNPMEDREFIAQMAQFSSLEQMLNFNKGMSKLIDNMAFQSSFNLLGMNVEIDPTGGAVTDENKTIISGMVESVTKKDNEVYVTVNGESYPASSIIGVKGGVNMESYTNPYYEDIYNEVMSDNTEDSIENKEKSDIEVIDVNE